MKVLDVVKMNDHYDNTSGASRCEGDHFADKTRGTINKCRAFLAELHEQLQVNVNQLRKQTLIGIDLLVRRISCRTSDVTVYE